MSKDDSSEKARGFLGRKDSVVSLRKIPSAVEQLIELQGEYRFGDKTKQKKIALYEKMMNVFTYEYINAVLVRGNDDGVFFEADIPAEADLPVKKITISGYDGLQVKLLCEDMDAGRNINMHPENYYVHNSMKLDWYSPYVRRSIDFMFNSPDELTVNALIQELSNSTSDSPRYHSEFNKKINDERFRERVMQVETFDELEGKLKIVGKYSKYSSDSRYREVLIKVLDMLHKTTPGIFPDYNAGFRTLLTQGAKAAVNLLNSNFPNIV